MSLELMDRRWSHAIINVWTSSETMDVNWILFHTDKSSDKSLDTSSDKGFSGASDMDSDTDKVRTSGTRLPVFADICSERL